MSIVVSWVTSCKNVALSQLLINFFFFFFAFKEIKSILTAEEEDIPTRSVPLPKEEGGILRGRKAWWQWPGR